MLLRSCGKLISNQAALFAADLSSEPGSGRLISVWNQGCAKAAENHGFGNLPAVRTGFAPNRRGLVVRALGPGLFDPAPGHQPPLDRHGTAKPARNRHRPKVAALRTGEVRFLTVPKKSQASVRQNRRRFSGGSRLGCSGFRAWRPKGGSAGQIRQSHESIGYFHTDNDRRRAFPRATVPLFADLRLNSQSVIRESDPKRESPGRNSAMRFCGIASARL